MSETDRGHHDIGGDPAGPVPRAEHALAPWEKEVDAIRTVLGRKGLMSADKLRLGIEQLPAEDYHRLSYYERWLASIAWTMEKDGIIPPGSFAARVAALEAKR
ncbi:nitrile hydratase [Elioraea sp.]|uniref:nitrile hydratase n=1 Tax=Elioraea sp. TaxID=2185103 RepID=UPI0021DE60CE|nr:MAG: hypothetical protein KatS3mg116_2794 [Elioraea sp.]